MTNFFSLFRLLTGRRAAPASHPGQAHGWLAVPLLLALATTAQAQTTTYAYTGTPQTYTVPAGVTAVRVVATGASGGVFKSNTDTNYSYGARAQATVLVTPGEVLTVQVGGRGGSGGYNGTAIGGYNGGGNADITGAGGGASDVRRASSVGATGDYLTTRNALLVAGGGGGSAPSPANGGTPNGGDGATGASYGSVGRGATQSGTGSGGGGYNGYGSNGTGGYYSGGGGGGYYGGGGSEDYAGSGGGSSWVMPAGSTGISYSVAAAVGGGAVSITPVPLPDLVVSTAGQTVAGGLYNSLTVQSGGVLNDGCQVLSGPGSFTLVAGGTLGICNKFGISATGSTGAIQVAGTRSFSPDASYLYTSGAQQTGPGLPATVRALGLANGFNLTLTNSVTATAAATFSQGVLATGANVLTLGPTATLSEDADGYVMGTVQTTRPLATAGATETFGGLGLRLTPGGTTLPGSTLVVRTTGTALPGAGGSQSVKRYFDIQPTVQAGLSVDLALTIRDDERNAISASRLRLFKSADNGATWYLQDKATVATTTPNGTQPTTYTASLGGITNFSLWTLGDVRTPLPVELTQFTATATGPAAVRLAWATASELNSQSFEVERRTDGQFFGTVGTVAAAGSSSAARSYEFQDAKLTAGATLLYYRLKQVDRDGTFSYSPVRAVTLKAAGGLALFPNPATTGATLTGAVPGAAVTVFDAVGRAVLTATADATGTARLVLPAGLPVGVYVVRTDTNALRLTVE